MPGEAQLSAKEGRDRPCGQSLPSLDFLFDQDSFTTTTPSMIRMDPSAG